MNIQKVVLFGPLPIRILAGITFIAHGMPKLVDPSMTQGFFGNIGLPPEMAIPIWLLEVVGRVCHTCRKTDKNSFDPVHNRNDRFNISGQDL